MVYWFDLFRDAYWGPSLVECQIVQLIHKTIRNQYTVYYSIRSLRKVLINALEMFIS